MSNNLYVVVDTSASMKKENVPQSAVELLENFEQYFKELFKNNQDNQKNIFYYQCGNGKNTLIDFAGIHSVFSKDISKIEGIALITESLKDLVMGLSQDDKNVIVVISDGYWCGTVADLKELKELLNSRKDTVRLIETNIGEINSVYDSCQCIIKRSKTANYSRNLSLRLLYNFVCICIWMQILVQREINLFGLFPIGNK